MEVTHINHLDTHAIVGGGKVQRAVVNQNAEFFEVLSSTLYSNKRLAVIREILCNANDANRDIGKAGTPVEVTLTATEFSIKDIGPGIPKAKMRDVYLNYGGSTKTHDGKQTGGFGLGSKAPFAYAKNFTVISEHGGMRTIYNLSRGTTESEGIPDIREIVSVPTTGTGLTVTVPLESGEDYTEFENLILNVARIGGIPIKLNGKGQRGIPYDKALDEGLPFVLIPKDGLPRHLSVNRGIAALFVKYGAVVYPVSTEIASSLYGGSPFYEILHGTELAPILLAPPNSIGVTPSRESLSYTDKTKETIKTLLAQSYAWCAQWKEEAIERRIAACRGRVNEYKPSDFDGIVKALLPGAGTYKAIMDLVPSFSAYIPDKAALASAEKIKEVIVTRWANKKPIITEAVCRLVEADPSQKVIHARAKAALKTQYPQHYKRTLKLIARRIASYHPSTGNHNPYNDSRVSIREQLKRQLALEVANLLTHLQLRFKSTPHLYSFSAFNNLSSISREGATAAEIRKLVRKDRYALNYFTDHIFEKKNGLREHPVIIARSEAAFRRVMRSQEGSLDRIYRYGLKIIIRQKDEYNRIRDYLRDVLKFPVIVDVTEEDKGLNQPKPGTRRFVMTSGYTERRDWQSVKGERVWYTTKLYHSQPVTVENPRYYMYVPQDDMIDGVNGKFLRQAKLKLDDNTLSAIDYLFPNLVVVPGTAEAALAEQDGLTNVFKVIAEETEEWLFAEGNVELFLHLLPHFSAYHHDYSFSLVMKTLGPARTLEAFGKTPTYVAPPEDLPTVVDLFIKLLKSRLPPKYGIQHLHAAANRFTDRFKSFFGDELQALNEPGFQEFMKHFPTIEMRDGQTALVFTTAMMSVVQALRLSHKLRKMELANG